MPERSFYNLPLEWVRAFQAAGETGNFTAAARVTGLTQAAVSQRIRNLEQHVGVQLFTRQARGVTLTAEGEAWLPHVTAALQALGRSTEELFGAPLKSLTISASNTVTTKWLVPRLGGLSGDLKHQISFTTMNIDPDFDRTDADLAVRYGRGDWPKLDAVRLYREVLSPVAAPALLKNSGDWRDLPVIAVLGPRPGWQVWALAAGEASMPRPVLRFDSYAAAHDAACQGQGVLLGSLKLCEDDLVAGRLQRLSDVVLQPVESYWLTAAPGRVPAAQWRQLTAAFGAADG